MLLMCHMRRRIHACHVSYEEEDTLATHMLLHARAHTHTHTHKHTKCTCSLWAHVIVAREKPCCFLSFLTPVSVLSTEPLRVGASFDIAGTQKR